MTRSTTNKTKTKRACTISCRVDDELHAALQHYCQVNQLVPSEGFRTLLHKQLMPSRARDSSKAQQVRSLLPPLHAVVQACESMARTVTHVARQGKLNDEMVQRLIDRLGDLEKMTMKGGIS